MAQKDHLRRGLYLQVELNRLLFKGSCSHRRRLWTFQVMIPLGHKLHERVRINAVDAMLSSARKEAKKHSPFLVFKQLAFAKGSHFPCGLSPRAPSTIVKGESLVCQSCPALCDLHGVWTTRLLCPWNFRGKNTGMSSHSLLQGIFPKPGIEPGSLALQADSLPPEPPEKSTPNIRCSLKGG